MIRRDWTEPLPKHNLLDLSNNVCYDQFLNHNYISNSNYPDDSKSYKLLGDYYKVNPKNIAIGYGSAELILRIFNLFKDCTFSIVLPTWQLAEMYARELGIKIIPYPEKSDILYIANPNGLNGTALSSSSIINLLSQYKLVIVDEAYGDFSNCSVLDSATTTSNLIVVKTLSKTVASPGLRFGYCFGNESIIKQIQDVRPGYVTTGSTLSALEVLLPQINLHIARMIDTRNYIEEKYNVVKSQGNYVLFKTNPHLPVITKQINGLHRMALTDLITFKEIENEYY